MTFNFSDLNPEFAKKAEDLLDALQNRGYTFQPTSGLRTLESQAKLWRQSRTKDVIYAEMERLRSLDCNYLADVIANVGPQYGAHVTNAIPGLSTHNWGEAMDVISVPRTKDDTIYYKKLADQAVKMGLCAGYYFKSFPDQGHIQLQTKEILQRMTLKDVNDHFEQKT